MPPIRSGAPKGGIVFKGFFPSVRSGPRGRVPPAASVAEAPRELRVLHPGIARPVLGWAVSSRSPGVSRYSVVSPARARLGAPRVSPPARGSGPSHGRASAGISASAVAAAAARGPVGKSPLCHEIAMPGARARLVPATRSAPPASCLLQGDLLYTVVTDLLQ